MKLAKICRCNAESLRQAIDYCALNHIGCFRVNSQILPLKTHPAAGYRVEDLPEGADVVSAFRACKEAAQQAEVRLSFHPDQFVVLNSTREDVVDRSLAELEYQAEVAEWIGADVVNIHAGGAFGSKSQSLDRLARALTRLSPRARARVTVENDDTTYAPADLLPFCRREGVPLVYDVHHHRCLKDELSVDDATDLAAATWNREPLFHISSPKDGWSGPSPRRHHDAIDIADFPACWWGRPLTVEVEAKGKEVAVKKLAADLVQRFRSNKPGSTGP